ncbi:hypothetical protein MUN53_01945 [Parabacteroides sp. AGMB00274]|uniref:Uncharacterized protein n=1 Tax=Parabacteroides faecalis TaxID=2924040 RepID=A0ABT0BXM9_9BACT|nr:hypothetical protein [Parabacteroides faecalis]MCJ2379385.1 hypothetical protein [Parabacteroides faecalis]
MTDCFFIYYDVNIFLDTVYITSSNNEDSNSVCQYRIGIARGDSYNGNGFNNMYIFTSGRLEELKIKSWQISPIVKMPYSWGGYSDEISVKDINGDLYTIKINPDPTSLFKKNDNFSIDIEYVFKTIRNLENILNISHLKILQSIDKLKKRLSFHSNKECSLATIDQYIQDIKQLKITCDSFIKEISDEQVIKTIKTEQNEIAKLFNQISLTLTD